MDVPHRGDHRALSGLERRRALRGAVALLGAAGAARRGEAQPVWPSRPIRLVVPYAPGGGTDTVARVLAERVGEALGQSLVVENRPGAGTVIGADAVAKAMPDGHALLFSSVTHAVVPALQRNLPYDPIGGFAPVGQVATFPFLLVVEPGLGVGSVAELVALLRARPGQVNYASVGTGTGTHLSGEMFKLLTRTDMVHVPHRGTAPALIELLAGRQQLMFADPPPVLEHLRSGRLLAIAQTTHARAAAFPDLPTLAEAGVPGFDFTSWWGVWAPAGTPQQVVERLSREFAAAVRQDAVRAQLARLGADPVGSGSEAFAALVRTEARKYARLVADAGVTVE